MIRRDALIANRLLYDENYYHVEDYKLWFEIAKNNKISNIPKVLLKYRVHINQINKKFYTEQFDNTIKLKKEIINYNLLKNEITFAIESYNGLKTLLDFERFINANKYRKFKKNIINMAKISIYLNSKPDVLVLWHLITSFDFIKKYFIIKNDFRIIKHHLIIKV